MYVCSWLMFVGCGWSGSFAARSCLDGVGSSTRSDGITWEGLPTWGVCVTTARGFWRGLRGFTTFTQQLPKYGFIHIWYWSSGWWGTAPIMDKGFQSYGEIWSVYVSADVTVSRDPLGFWTAQTDRFGWLWLILSTQWSSAMLENLEAFLLQQVLQENLQCEALRRWDELGTVVLHQGAGTTASGCKGGRRLR